ncbi:TonB family protein [Undibacterium sp. Ji67W]|uniref:TonB family protein n=1 Tax=Undibacterium sp. Ji67W TaxID=3413042 RepID=UPI003BF1FA00
MKKRFIIATISGLLSACVSQYPNDFYTRPAPVPLGNSGGNMAVQKTSSSTRSAADSVDNYKVEIASRIAQMNANFVYPGNPQSMLRSVVVVHYVLAADGRLVKAEIVRSNQDKYAETTALASLQNSAPFPPPNPRLLRGGRFDVSETWLFNDDGRFQLRSIALPQASE